MPAASILIKPASGNCNMECGYCFYKALSSNREECSKGIMSEETLEELVRQAIDYADGVLTFAFQGGEPTLAGLEFYAKAVHLQERYNAKGLRIQNTLQTNGIGMDEAWADFLAENRFLVGLSLDGPRKIHDRYRRGMDGEGTFHDVMGTVDLFERRGVDYNVLSVVTSDSSGKAESIYRFFRRHRFQFLQFIPCMDESVRCSGTKGPYAVNAQEYGRFLCQMFDLWYEDFMKGEDVEIRMFSNLAGMAAGYPSEECGMSGCCTCYFAVEADGSVYPCDFYCQDMWYLGKVREGFANLQNSDRAREFIGRSHKGKEDCPSCPYVSLCHGGCRRWRERGGGAYGKNLLCEAYQTFFSHAWERLHRLGELVAAYHRDFRRN